MCGPCCLVLQPREPVGSRRWSKQHTLHREHIILGKGEPWWSSLMEKNREIVRGYGMGEVLVGSWGDESEELSSQVCQQQTMQIDCTTCLPQLMCVSRTIPVLRCCNVAKCCWCLFDDFHWIITMLRFTNHWKILLWCLSYSRQQYFWLQFTSSQSKLIVIIVPSGASSSCAPSTLVLFQVVLLFQQLLLLLLHQISSYLK